MNIKDNKKVDRYLIEDIVDVYNSRILFIKDILYFFIIFYLSIAFFKNFFFFYQYIMLGGGFILDGVDYKANIVTYHKNIKIVFLCFVVSFMYLLSFVTLFYIIRIKRRYIIGLLLFLVLFIYFFFLQYLLISDALVVVEDIIGTYVRKYGAVDCISLQMLPNVDMTLTPEQRFMMQKDGYWHISESPYPVKVFSISSFIKFYIELYDLINPDYIRKFSLYKIYGYDIFIHQRKPDIVIYISEINAPYLLEQYSQLSCIAFVKNVVSIDHIIFGQKYYKYLLFQEYSVINIIEFINKFFLEFKFFGYSLIELINSNYTHIYNITKNDVPIILQNIPVILDFFLISYIYSILGQVFLFIFYFLFTYDIRYKLINKKIKKKKKIKKILWMILWFLVIFILNINYFFF